MLAPLHLREYKQDYVPVAQYQVLSFGNHSAMLMLRSYMDESGKYDDPNIVTVSVCGAVASLDQWTGFEKEWKRALDDYHVSWFHMREFAFFKGEFKGWTEPRRQEFLGKLIDIMNKNIVGYLAATMSKLNFDLLTKEQQSVIGNDPYYPCFMACVIHSAQTVLHLAPEEKVELFFADNPDFKGNAQEFWRRCKSIHAPEDIRKRLGTVTLNAEPRDVLPLQAADLVAYEVNHHLTEMYKTQQWPKERWAYNQLKEKMLFIEVFDQKTLSERFGF